jgi:hypothetical protein
MPYLAKTDGAEAIIPARRPFTFSWPFGHRRVSAASKSTIDIARLGVLVVDCSDGWIIPSPIYIGLFLWSLVTGKRIRPEP